MAVAGTPIVAAAHVANEYLRAPGDLHRPAGRRGRADAAGRLGSRRGHAAYDVPSSGTVGGAFYGAGTSGTARIVVDERRGVIVGATFTGTDVADWLQAATITTVSETPVDLLWQAVPVFPTRSEIWLKLLERREAGLAGAAPQFPPSARPLDAQPSRPRRGQEPLATAQR